MAKPFKSAAIGFGLAILFGAAAFTVAPQFLRAYIAPARILIPGFDRIANAVIISLLFGEGTPAKLYLIPATAVLFWALLFSAAHLSWSAWQLARRRKAAILE